MLKLFLGLCTALCITNSWTVLCQLTVPGTCTQFGRTQLPIFAMTPYMGLWYIQGRYDYASTPEIADCMTSVYIKTSWGNAKIVEGAKFCRRTQRCRTHQIDSLMIFNRPTKGHYTYEIPAAYVWVAWVLIYE